MGRARVSLVALLLVQATLEVSETFLFGFWSSLDGETL